MLDDSKLRASFPRLAKLTDLFARGNALFPHFRILHKAQNYLEHLGRWDLGAAVSF
jgi:hypothetical protein